MTRWRAAMRMQVDDDRSDEERCGRRGRDSRGQTQTNPTPHPLRYWMQIIVDKSIGVNVALPGKGTTGKGGHCHIPHKKVLRQKEVLLASLPLRYSVKGGRLWL